MIKNILLDMGGVVFIQDTDEAIRRFRKLGIVDTDKYMGAYGQKDFFLDIETGDIDTDEFCRRMALAIGKESVSWEEAQYCWLGFIKDVPVDRLHFLAQLRQHYHVCLLSNTNPFIMAYTRSKNFSKEGRPISDYFDSLFCSCEMKAYKPHADMFQKALDADGMKASESLFIDDSSRNTDAARALGFEVLPVKTNEDWRPLLMERLGNNH
jgi:FMN phosphatase YigB (HAD superfamily)